MRKTPILLALALASTAQADRFYFGREADDKKVVAGEGATAESIVHGVLLREQDGLYVIRIEGGEVWVEKSRIYKVERDGLTVAQLEEREKAAQTKLAESGEKRARSAAEAAAPRPRIEPPAESAAKSMRIEVDFDGLLPGYKFAPNSDVLRRVDVASLSATIETWLLENGVQPRASAKRDFDVQIDFKGLLPAMGLSIYDPVVHRVDLNGLARRIEDYLRGEVERAANRRPSKVN
jgi:hypothetical protein